MPDTHTVRRAPLKLWITPAEYVTLAETARLAGLTLSDYVRIRLGIPALGRLVPSNKRRSHEDKALPTPTDPAI